MIAYDIPKRWIQYDPVQSATAFAETKASILSLQTVPYQRRWVEQLQAMELKREVAGTSRIEGADFTEQELDRALRTSPDEHFTRSQKQAHAVVNAYRWIAELPQDRPVTGELILNLHRTIVTGADDDHCPPGKLRRENQNVQFGMPRHRGVEGGRECDRAFQQFSEALQTDYQAHDPIICALAAHYHLAAMHPFLDGNGRTARALEALLLQRAGLRDTCFIAMSSYYDDEKPAYLAALTAVRQSGHDLTPFLLFGLRGVALQSKRLLGHIQHHISRALYRNTMNELFGRLKSPRKRFIAERQMEILTLLLDVESMELDRLVKITDGSYGNLKNPWTGLVRDLTNLQDLNAITITQTGAGRYELSVRLEWPTTITETEFFAKIRHAPKAKTLSFLR